MSDGSYKTLNALMRHIRDSGVVIRGSADKAALAQLGYFHGYKGYRWSGEPSRRIPFSDFSQLRAVIEFDMGLKALLYPVIMRLEMAMKNLTLIEILESAQSSSLRTVYARLMPGTKARKRAGKLEVMHANNEALLKAYNRRDPIARHYYDSPREAVPVWGLLEIVTLGHFARFLEQLDDEVLSAIAQRWGMQRRDGDLVPHLVFAVTGLRNAVAHNGMVFDTRFATGSVRKQVAALLVREIEMGPSVRVEFSTITDYVVLVTYLSGCMGLPRHEIVAMIRQYRALTDDLRGTLSVGAFDMIVHTNNRTKIDCLIAWMDAE